MCIMFDRAASTQLLMLKASWLLSIICECLILARHVMCEQSSIIRLPILHCKPLQLKGFVPVLVLLRMTNSDSDIHSRRPLFWAPADGEALGPNLQSTTLNWRLGYASKTELHGVMQLLGSAGNHRCSVSCSVQQRCTASCETLDGSSERGRKRTDLWGSLMLRIPRLPESCSRLQDGLRNCSGTFFLISLHN